MLGSTLLYMGEFVSARASWSKGLPSMIPSRAALWPSAVALTLESCACPGCPGHCGYWGIRIVHYEES